MPQEKNTSKKTTVKNKSNSKTQPNNSKINQDESVEKGSGFQSVILFAIAIFFVLLAFIQGSAGWYFLHCFIRGVFGFSIIIVPIILLVCAFRRERRDNMTLLKRLLIGLVITVLVSSFIQVIFVGDIEKKNFFRAISYLYETAADNAFTSGGVISAILAYPLLRLFGSTGARIIVIILLFVGIMWMFDLSMHQLITGITYPFWKMRATKQEKKENNEENEDTYSVSDTEPLPEDINEELPLKRTNLKNRLAHILHKDDSDNDGIEKDTPNDMLDNSDKLDDTVYLEPIPDISTQDAFSEDFDELLEETTDTTPNDDSYDMDIDIPLYNDSSKKDVTVNDTGTVPLPIDSTTETVSSTTDIASQPYQLPSTNILACGVSRAKDPAAEQELKRNATILVDTLANFGVTVRIAGTSRGPAVTRYEIQPAAGVKVSKITGLADDIALSLAAQGVRIEAPVPGKPVIGIEVPNQHKDTVSLREILESEAFQNAKSKLSFAVGRDIAGNAIVGDIAKLPHMIIAGSTGSGKSVCTNSIIMSILFHASPDEVKLILIDPKIVEFTVYEGIPHLLIPVVTDPKKAAGSLNWAVAEMQRRYNLFAENSVRDLGDYNAMAINDDSIEPLPQIVIIIDELADLMMTTSKEVEDSICRLAQKARAAGMHLIIATQRPTTDIITGLIKANIPSRIALSVMSQIDSRTILDMGGAEKLLGHGDMLYLPNGMLKPIRVQGCYTSTKDVETTVAFIKSQAESTYSDAIIEAVERSIPVTKADKKEKKASAAAAENHTVASIGDMGNVGSDEEVLERAIEFVVEAGQASTSSLQRRLKLGYAKAARMMDEMEQMGIIGPSEGAKPRKVLLSKEQYEERRMRRLQ